MIRPGALAAGWILSMAAGTAPLQADYLYGGAEKIQDSDIEQFMSALAWELRSCQTESIAARFAPGAAVLLINAKGKQEWFAATEHAKLGELCRPYRLIRWDGSHNEIGLSASGMAGHTATARWRLEWGGQEPGRDGSPTLMFENWVELVKRENRVSIVRAGMQARELVPGAEKTFHLKSEGGDFLYPLLRVGMAVGGVVEGAFNFLKEMVGIKSVKQDNRLNALPRAN